MEKILDNSHAVNHWLRKLRKPENKRNVLRMFLWWLKTDRPELCALEPDGLIEYQKNIFGTEDEFKIHDVIDDWIHYKSGRRNTLRATNLQQGAFSCITELN